MRVVGSTGHWHRTRRIAMPQHTRFASTIRNDNNASTKRSIMRYLSPLHRQLRDDIRPPGFAAELLLSDKPLPHPWFGTTDGMRDSRLFQQKSLASQWLDAHDLIARSSTGDSSMVWTRKGELYRYRIRAAGLLSALHTDRVTALWQWAREGNGPSVWHGVTDGMAWP
jgi:hypothetical protein